ncbi:hypothetical protein D3C74_244290 [compost metagenome]
MLANRSQKLWIVVGGATRPRFKSALLNGFGRIGDKQVLIDDHLHAKSITLRTSPKRAVERKHPRRQLLHAKPANRASIVGAKAKLLLADYIDEDLSAGHLKRGFDGIR